MKIQIPSSFAMIYPPTALVDRYWVEFFDAKTGRPITYERACREACQIIVPSEMMSAEFISGFLNLLNLHR